MNTNIESLIIRVLTEEVTEKEMKSFSKWFHAKEKNKILFFQLKQLYDNRKKELPLSPSKIDESWNRLKKKLERNSRNVVSPETRSKKINSTKWIAAAIAALLIVVGTLFYTQQEKSVTWVEVRTAPHNYPKKITLPDGSLVQLNASSILKYPKEFKDKKREVHLDGEALFDVVKNHKQSFVVHSNKQQINVLGTTFNVMDYSSDAYSVTTLITGKVQLEAFDSGKKLKTRIAMSPNQQLSFNKNTEQITLTDITNSKEITSWTSGVYSFQDTSLEKIANRLEKMYGIVILITDKQSREEKYTGKFSLNQDINEVIDIINFKHQFNCTFQGNKIILEKNRN